MKVALVYNLRPAQATTAAWPDDLYAEWDEPETIAAVRAALATEHEVVLIENNSEVEAGLGASAPDIVFNMAEGLSGSDREAYIPALLERWGIPFTGSSAHTLRTCLDKAATKRVLQQHGLPTPAYTVISCAERLPALPAFPLIVKPLHEGSSKGIEQASIVHTRGALQARVAYVLATYRQPALVETFVPGREFTVALLGNGAEVTVLPLVEICFAALPLGALPLYSYAAKWRWDTPEHALDILRCPTELTEAMARRIADLCRRAFLALECRDWCRIDVRLDTHGQPQILELNPLPGILPDPQRHSCFPKAAAAAHISYAALIRRVLTHACQRYGLPLPALHPNLLAAGEEMVVKGQ
jgi:D-alanine-D-alanine ligase